jgi:hypothetical protein
MKIRLCRSPFGLSGAYDEDREYIKTLDHRIIYEVDIKEQRNAAFHRKYFALFRIAWEYQNEDTQSFFGCFDTWRKAVEVAAGNFELEYSLDRNEWVQRSKSIAFDKMTEDDFRNLYERVKHILFTTFLPEDVEDEFWEATKDF